MKQYEYKFIPLDIKLGFNFDKKCKESEMEWNELGKQGWKFCCTLNACIVFIRELQL